MPNLPYPYLDQAEFPSVPAALVTALQGNYDDLRLRLASAEAKVWPRTVTNLPTSPTNGQEVFYVADSTNGVVWHLKYRSASASSYKWEFVGGPPLTSDVDTDESTTSAAYADLATAGPSITVPLEGDYDIAFGANAYSTVNGIAGVMAYALGATAASDADAIHFAEPGGVNSGHASGMRHRREGSLPASTAIVTKYRTITGGSAVNFRYRWLRVTPVRLG